MPWYAKLGVALGVIFVAILVLAAPYNGLVAKRQGVHQTLSEVQVQEKRRFDLIPNLVKTVEGYAAHEKGIFEAVAKARAEVGRVVINVDPATLNDPETLRQLQAAQAQMASALSRLIAVAESYPQLKANENFLALQKQLEGTENRIAVARRNNVIATREYNQAIEVFPGNIYAGIFGFRSMAYFSITEPERQVPQVRF